MKPLTSWSFSRYSKYTTCPAQFKYNVLLKMPEPKNKALERGAQVHDDISAWLKGEARTMPKDLGLVKDVAKEIKDLLKKRPERVVVEDDWSFKQDWSSTRWDDWAECWVRLKLDAAVLKDDVLYVIDWKTGKFRPENHQQYLEQLELYALGGLLKFEAEAREVRPQLIYIDSGQIHESPKVYTVADVKGLKKTWEKRVAPMFKDKTFKPKPSDACRWCVFSKSRSGPCQY